MHELDADIATIGFVANLDDLLDRRRFQAEHVIDEDRPVEIAFREAVARRIEVGVRNLVDQSQRVEIGVQVATDPIVPDQHEGAQRIRRRLPDLFRRRHRLGGELALLRRCLRETRGRVRHGKAAIAATAADDRGFPRRPAGAVAVAQKLIRIVVQAGEELRPVAIDGPGIVQVLGVQFSDIRLVGPKKERGVLHIRCHFGLLFSRRRRS